MATTYWKNLAKGLERVQEEQQLLAKIKRQAEIDTAAANIKNGALEAFESYCINYLTNPGTRFCFLYDVKDADRAAVTAARALLAEVLGESYDVVHRHEFCDYSRKELDDLIIRLKKEQ
jgi:hypothetical protein